MAFVYMRSLGLLNTALAEPCSEPAHRQCRDVSDGAAGMRSRLWASYKLIISKRESVVQGNQNRLTSWPERQVGRLRIQESAS